MPLIQVPRSRGRQVPHRLYHARHQALRNRGQAARPSRAGEAHLRRRQGQPGQAVDAAPAVAAERPASAAAVARLRRGHHPGLHRDAVQLHPGHVGRRGQRAGHLRGFGRLLLPDGSQFVLRDAAAADSRRYTPDLGRDRWRHCPGFVSVGGRSREVRASFRYQRERSLLIRTFAATSISRSRKMPNRPRPPGCRLISRRQLPYHLAPELDSVPDRRPSVRGQLHIRRVPEQLRTYLLSLLVNALRSMVRDGHCDR